MKKENKLKKESGVTIIALAITIIVLLILTGVTLGTVFSNTGVLENVQIAKLDNEIEEEKEILKISLLKAIKSNKSGEIEELKLRNALIYYLDLEGDEEINTLVVTYNQTNEIFTVTLPSGRIYTIDQYRVIRYNNIII